MQVCWSNHACWCRCICYYIYISAIFFKPCHVGVSVSMKFIYIYWFICWFIYSFLYLFYVGLSVDFVVSKIANLLVYLLVSYFSNRACVVVFKGRAMFGPRGSPAPSPDLEF